MQHALGYANTKDELGGAEVHSRSGVVDNIADTEEQALLQIRRFLSDLPPHVGKLPPILPCSDPVTRREETLLSIVPRADKEGYDMRLLMQLVLDVVPVTAHSACQQMI